MDDNQYLLERFEQGLNPQSPEDSEIAAEVVGYGEISSIFSVEGIYNWIFKRLPLFDDNEDAETYVENYTQYVDALKQAGLKLPKDNTHIIKGKRITLYVGQEEFQSTQICHNLLHTLSQEDCLTMIQEILIEIKKVTIFNSENSHDLALSIDGQISNWALVDNELIYVDTSTPMYKRNGQEQLDPELLLNSTPGALKWIIRKYFLQGVMERYYDLRLVFIDVIANLYKEQKRELIDDAIRLTVGLLPDDVNPITRKEIDAYYREDKFTWNLFLFFRKIDRWFTNVIFKRQYQFILPGKIKR